MVHRAFNWFITAGLVLTALLYVRVLDLPFVDWDDPGYISENDGCGPLSIAQVGREFTRYVMGNWHPLTMLSYSADLSMFGMEPGGMHGTNLLLHLVNALLVALFIRRLTGDPLVAALTMLLWAVHPLRVESVAWVSGRKDLLMTLFGLLTLLLWLQWKATGRLRFFLASLIAFVLACFSKGMAVSLVPCLWLVDRSAGRPLWTRNALLEKLPFVVVAIVIGLVTLDAQSMVMKAFAQHMDPLDRFHVGPANLLVYSVQQVLPIGLNAKYAYPLVNGQLATWYVPACYATLLVLGLLVWRGRWGSPVVFGVWFFVLNTVLVLQWLPVGDAIRADRYTYIAGIGAALVIAIGIVHLGRWLSVRYAPIVIATTTSMVMILFGSQTWARIPTWSSPEAVWSDMIAGRPRDPAAYVDRAITFKRKGNNAEAMADFDRAVARAGSDLRPFYERGMHHLAMERYNEAMNDLLKVFMSGTDHPGLVANMLFAEYALGHCDDVERNATQAMTKDTLSMDLLNLRAACRIERGEPELALADLLRSLRLDQARKETWMLMAHAFRLHGDTAMACRILRSGLAGTKFEHPLLERMRIAEMGNCTPYDP